MKSRLLAVGEAKALCPGDQHGSPRRDRYRAGRATSEFPRSIARTYTRIPVAQADKTPVGQAALHGQRVTMASAEESVARVRWSRPAGRADQDLEPAGGPDPGRGPYHRSAGVRLPRRRSGQRRNRTGSRDADRARRDRWPAHRRRHSCSLPAPTRRTGRDAASLSTWYISEPGQAAACEVATTET